MAKFVKGQSGNPGGRPKGAGEIAQAARKHGKEAIKTLATLMRESEDERVRVSASEALLNRGYGKPTQPVSGDEDGEPIRTVTEIVIRGIDPGS